MPEFLSPVRPHTTANSRRKSGKPFTVEDVLIGLKMVEMIREAGIRNRNLLLLAQLVKYFHAPEVPC
jgi:hypothetical protein